MYVTEKKYEVVHKSTGKRIFVYTDNKDNAIVRAYERTKLPGRYKVSLVSYEQIPVAEI